MRLCRFCGEYDETVTHLMLVCPRFLSAQREVLQHGVPTADMKWSVREILDFSYVPGINEAYEGTWASADPPLEDDDTLGLDWLESDPGDENNNNSTITNGGRTGRPDT